MLNDLIDPPVKVKKIIHDNTNEASIDPQPMMLMRFLERPFPNNPIIRKPRSGNNGTRQVI